MKSIIPLTIPAVLASVAGLAISPLADQAAPVDNATARPKKIFAHFMACTPAASGPTVFDFRFAQNLRHDQPGETERLGGHVRNWCLPSPANPLSLHDSCDLEIRRAIHIGFDGFTIDAWAGGQSAKDTLDMLFQVAEEKNYPFEITITPDPNCLGSETAVDTVKYLLAKHGKSPKLARRDGKPLIFGYQSVWVSIVNGEDAYEDNPSLKGSWIWDQAAWRSTPKGWDYMGRSMETFQKKVGQPLYLEFAMDAFNYGIKDGGINEDQQLEAAGILAKHVGAVGSWGWMGNKQTEVGKNVVKNGAEWMFPIGFGQKENIPFESYGPAGLEWFIGSWQGAIADNSTLMQYVTWNDYGENSALAPAFNTRYALYDLTSYFVGWWKHGKPPVPDHDKVYLVYHKYPKGAKIFPFQAKFTRDAAPVLEVVSILTKPGTIRLPGRDAEYQAPAGFFNKQFPNSPGPAVAEVLRDGKVTTHLESPEPITDKPFREDNGYVGFSTEDARHWKADFGDKPMWTYSEYGDDDHDGLPNWFEEYYFGTWMDPATDTIADPNADPDGDGRTNLQEYQDRTDPTLSPEEEKMAVKLPLAAVRHRARGELTQPGSVQLPFANASFEQAGENESLPKDWGQEAGATRTREKASSGQWSIKLGKAAVNVFQGLASGAGYSWNCDALEKYALRAGCTVGYSVDIASEKQGTSVRGYMRLCQDRSASGYEMWGLPVVSTASAKFVTRAIATQLNLDIRPGNSIGGMWMSDLGNKDTPAAVYLDNFSPLTILRPLLKLTGDQAVYLGSVPANTAAESSEIGISNGQTGTLPQNWHDGDAVTQVPTVLYGLADMKLDGKGFDQMVAGATDHVGAVLLGDEAKQFEFVSEHRGATPQELKLIGQDGQPGLSGGPAPESEVFKIRFTGNAEPGVYKTTLRIVTQAANTGKISLARPGEPPFNLFYTDIPVSVTVK